MNTFKVYYDPQGLKELLEQTPFNLAKDLKKLDKTTIESIAEEIANELQYEISHPPVISILHWGKKRQAASAKIRVVDVARDAGKSSGYRCIVLIDCINNAVFLLHLYRHSHGEDENISKKAQNQLKKLVDEYEESLNASAKDK